MKLTEIRQLCRKLPENHRTFTEIVLRPTSACRTARTASRSFKSLRRAREGLSGVRIALDARAARIRDPRARNDGRLMRRAGEVHHRIREIRQQKRWACLLIDLSSLAAFRRIAVDSR